MSDLPASESLVIVQQQSHLGRITLNRPQAINALNLEMIRTIARSLDAFENSPQIETVLIDGVGPRGLCAGGDIRYFYESMVSGDASPRTFFREEYRLNARIAHYTKPIVSFMDGLVNGGGVGLSAHASLRIATERSSIAMPEVTIGFSPDVGSSWLFSRLPNQWGIHLALTAQQLGAIDALECGLCDVIVDSSSLDDLAEALANTSPEEALAKHELLTNAFVTESAFIHSDWINSCYSAHTADKIVERLFNYGAVEADNAAEMILSKSPTAIKVTLRSLREAQKSYSLEECLNREYATSCTYLETPDFMEGIRAQVIDKDRNPQWQPSHLDDVFEEDIDVFFEETSDELPFS